MWNPQSFIRWQVWCKQQRWLDILRQEVIMTVKKRNPDGWRDELKNWVVGGKPIV